MIEKVALRHRDSESEKVLAINWKYFNVCNYSCSYCPSRFNDGSLKGVGIETVKSFLLRLKNHYKNKNIYLEFSGGEITHWNDFIELGKFLKKNEIHLGFLSNGSKGLGFWNSIAEFTDRLILSFHVEYSDPMHFVDIYNALSEKVAVHVNVMIKHDQFDDSIKAAQKMSSYLPENSVSIHKLFYNGQGGKSYPYTPLQRLILSDYVPEANSERKSAVIQRDYSLRNEMVEHFDDGSEKMLDATQAIAQGTNSWKGWTCFAGVENLSISLNGNVYRGVCGVGGSLGSIYRGDVILPKEPVLCPYDRCECGFDIASTKIKNE